MKIYRIVLLVVSFCLLCTSVVTLSMGWLTNVWPAAPALPFSAGNTQNYTFYKITFAKNGTTFEGNTTTKIEENYQQIGETAFNAGSLQFGTITNLYFLENDNYVFYAVEIPYELGTEVHAAVSYGKYNDDGSAAVAFGDHFKIYNEGGTEITDATKLTNVKGIETTYGSTFISYACALSEQAPSADMDFTALDSLFKNNTLDKFMKEEADGTKTPKLLPLATMTEQTDGTYTAAMNSTEDAIGTFAPENANDPPEKYYLYIKLQPNMELYKYFIDYLYADMPFYLAYQVGIQLSVRPASN